jgi:hypothetical protein
MDDRWWQSLSQDLQAAYQKPCVKLVAEKKVGGNQNRRLYDVQACKP